MRTVLRHAQETQVHRLQQKSPLSASALRAMMELSLTGFGPSAGTAEERAQDLVYKAMEAATPAKRLRLAQQALDLDPENADALLMLADASPIEGSKRIEVLRGVVAAAAKRLGSQAFKELVPHFWGSHETRPYMRAREQLAEALQAAGRLDEAVREYEEMLRLNEKDNQGKRYELLCCLLALGRLAPTQELIGRFEADLTWNVVFAWGRVLERLLAKDEAAARQALVAARKQNPHMEAFLTGRRKVPRNLPDSYSPGNADEAAGYTEPLLMAWQPHDAARAWLSVQAGSTALKNR